MSESVERLAGDCERCAGLCCVALPFTASADFAVNKAAGTPCGNLTADNRCGIHARLRESGFSGCSVYDCYGAGQRVSQRADLTPGPRMFEVFRVTRQLHELLWYLTEAARCEEPTAPRGESPEPRGESPEPRGEPGALSREASGLRDEIDQLVGGSADELVATEVNAWRARVGEVLGRVSERARAGLGGRELRGADLAGKRMRGASLRGANLRGALLIATDLRGADLRSADLLGADLRDADLRGADLTDCLFLAQPQLNAAQGDLGTSLPVASGGLTRPGHWQDTHSAGQHEEGRHMRAQRRGKTSEGGGGRRASGREGRERGGRGGQGQARSGDDRRGR
ncbi:pentapeptide repeat-containing protein [Streptomyces iconiensis]|uniref:pentapeptide repeat-containing protein n=1 Tax=Streptomyces iconiensis TaxID=1384038 RepID=UPI00321A2097